MDSQTFALVVVPLATHTAFIVFAIPAAFLTLIAAVRMEAMSVSQARNRLTIHIPGVPKDSNKMPCWQQPPPADPCMVQADVSMEVQTDLVPIGSLNPIFQEVAA
jgi:hypothetical protein